MITKIKFIIAFAMLCIPPIIRAQTYLPLIEQGKEWYTVHIFEGINATRLYVSENYSAAHDTLYYHIEQFPQAVWLMVREDVNAKKVYTRNFLDGNPTGPEKILYDFSLEEGDSVYVNGASCPAYKTWCYVDSVKYLNFMSLQRKVLYMRSKIEENGSPFFPVWVEGIGSLAGIQNSIADPIIWGCDELTCCYFNNGLIYQSQNGTQYGCSFEFVDIEDIKHENSAKFHPNPVIDISKIEFNNKRNEPVRICIYDVFGKLKKSYETTNNYVEIKKTDFDSGIFLYQISKNNQIFYTNKFIIQ